MSTELTKPQRAIRLTLAIESDSISELCDALIGISDQIERGELTTGVSGGCGSGYIYELLQDENQTHDNYFKELNDYLAAAKESKS